MVWGGALLIKQQLLSIIEMIKFTEIIKKLNRFVSFNNFLIV
jgi:hypothetical protein